MASVEIQTPDGVVQVRLDRDHLTIGRLANNAIALPYPHISRQHAELRQMGQTWWIVDMRSTNGLHVAGQRVSECQLTPETFVMLSPLVTLRLIEERTAAFPLPGAQGLRYAPGYAPGYGAPSQVPAPPPSMPSMPSIAPSAGPISMSEPIRPLSALGPRSPYADDEAPFYPQMRQPAGPYYQGRAPAPPIFPGAQGGREAPPVAAHPAARPPAHIGRVEQPGAAPAAPAALSAPAGGEQRRTSFMAPSPLLHVCQTCGQRTTPDAVYCQNCHHSIATECARCRLSLLPIQDLCPRCQTPNPASVRRPRAAGAW